MVRETVEALPEWFIGGLILGGLFSVVVAVVFVAGHRAFARIGDGSATGRADGGERSTDRRWDEIRYYLDAIGERHVEGKTIGGQRVAFYLPDRDVAVTFDAHVFFGLQSTDTEVVLIEHELPGGNLGSRLPFDAPELSIGARNDDGIAAAFAALGLPECADLEDVQRAYRARVKEVHPDQGGDEEEFRRVREAYDTAKEHAD